MSTYGHGASLQRRLIEVLRSDGALSTSPGGLLYPDWSPKFNDVDSRVYPTNVQFPTGSELIRMLPRVLVEVHQRSHDYEQEAPGILQGPVRVWVHTVVPLEEEELGERIDAYLNTLLLSTWLSDARIIAGRLVASDDRRRTRLEAFNGAWEFVSGFTSPNVGAIA